MSRPPTPRAIARAETLGRIKSLALAQLADSGATTISLRAIARDLGIVSSAIYRYYGSRDELLTALIVDAYEDLAAAVESATDHPRRGARRRFVDGCRALRDWARSEPHRWALVYGSAIPGYVAPQDTVAPAARVVRALCGPVVGHVTPPGPAPRGRLGSQLEATAAALDLAVDPSAMLLLTGAFGRLVGLLTLELNGHFVGGLDPADELWLALVEREADALGL
ncbi:TetR/AcrR family transcriptional regulator [Nocardioides sp. SYSU DS0663]|uniref:TetR/AcrR family transcriptional regulator n=1 Tax=Nocardioides sp. SYSU DS0663 TaxID=3416445 RepID=UPI003F4BC797